MDNARINEHISLLREHAVDFISEEELREKLKSAARSQRPLRIKIGFDPTARDIHLGHTVLLRKLRTIQDAGHLVFLVIGDFTAQIGDPSGRSELRPLLSSQEIADNARTYTDQAFKILDKTKTKIVFNSSWFNTMTAGDFVALLSRYTLARMIERDDFALRLKNSKPLSLQELVYPIIQGYDSVKVEADIEFGGTDQKFNLLVGRHLQESFGQAPQCIITLPLLVGLDGKNKMSKSLGNYVGVTEEASSMFGKLMSISDELMWEYAALLTELDIDSLKKMHPKEAKLALAQDIVGFYHSPALARSQREEFEKVFSKKELPSDLDEYICEHEEVDVIEVLFASKLVSSKNEARRLLSQKSVSSEGQVLSEPALFVPPEGIVLKVGKRRFLKLLRPR